MKCYFVQNWPKYYREYAYESILLPYSTFFGLAINFAFLALLLISVGIYFNELWQQRRFFFVFLVNQEKKILCSLKTRRKKNYLLQVIVKNTEANRRGVEIQAKFSTHATSSYENAPTDEFVGRLTSRSFWKQIKVTYQIRYKIGLCGLIWKALSS